MIIFEIPVSLFVIAYVFAIALAFTVLRALDVLHEVVLPSWIHHGTFGLALVLIAAYFLLLFGFGGLIFSIFFPMDTVFTFAFCAGFLSLIHRNDSAPVRA